MNIFKTVKELKEEISYLKKESDKAREEILKLKNPPKYKAGDKVEHYLIIKHLCYRCSNITDLIIRNMLSGNIYLCFNEKTNESQDVMESDLKNLKNNLTDIKID